MKKSKKIAMTMATMMAMSMMPPASLQAEAAVKTFTYAEQKSGEEVTAVTMKPGEQYDIKFIGVSDWRNYSRQWKEITKNVQLWIRMEILRRWHLEQQKLNC